MNNNTLLLILAVLVIVGVVVYSQRGWSCVNGECQRMIGGKYPSPTSCEQECDGEEEPKTYDCVQNTTGTYGCKESEGGQFSTLQDCVNSCRIQPPTYFYPTPVYVRSWGGWGGRRGWRRRRRRRGP